MTAPLISSQRCLDPAKVLRKACRFRVFIVRAMELELRGRRYRTLLDGHHNLAAAKMRGVAPTWRGPSNRTRQVMRELSTEAFARMLINNLTDSDWYFVESGEVVQELLGCEKEAPWRPVSGAIIFQQAPNRIACLFACYRLGRRPFFAIFVSLARDPHGPIPVPPTDFPKGNVAIQVGVVAHSRYLE